MPYQFTRHYTLAEARALLPQIRAWLERLRPQVKDLHDLSLRLNQLSGPGDDLGGPLVNEWFKTLTRCAEIFAEFHRRQIAIKDLERGLIDIPSLRGDREVFLCWEQDEDDIQFWHDLDAGYSGREQVDD